MGALLLSAPAIRSRPGRHHAYECPLCGRVGDDPLCPEDQIACLRLVRPRCDPSRLPPGFVLGRKYRIEAQLGWGGSSVVYRARHLGTGQLLALKVACVSAEDDSTALKRFFREARAMAQLRHANTIRVFDFGQDERGIVYIALELLTGRTLQEEQKRRKDDGRGFTEEEAVEIAVAVLQSLAEAHDNGLVHRDLKPSNVFLQRIAGDRTSIKVLDFGIAKMEGAPLTCAGCVIGTAAYMSPEQARNVPIDGRADLYALGVILFRLIAGRLPFPGVTPLEILTGHVNDPPPDLRALAPTPLSEGFVAIVNRALEKAPDDRFENARAMEKALVSLGASAGRRPSTTAPIAVVGGGEPSTQPIVEIVPYVEERPPLFTLPRLIAVALAAAFALGIDFGSNDPAPPRPTVDRSSAPAPTSSEIAQPLVVQVASPPISAAPAVAERSRRVLRSVPKVRHAARPVLQAEKPQPEPETPEPEKTPRPEPARPEPPKKAPEPSVLKRKI